MLHIWGEVAHFPIISKVRRIYQFSSGLIPIAHFEHGEIQTQFSISPFSSSTPPPLPNS